jgi:hypothetical protein
VQVPHAQKKVAFHHENANGAHFDKITPGTITFSEEEQTQSRSVQNDEVCNP